MFVKGNDVLSHLFKPTLIIAVCSLTDLITWDEKIERFKIN